MLEKLEPKDWFTRKIKNARNDYVAVRRMQKPQLHNDEEQEEAFRAAGDEEVLQYVPAADGAQGSEIAFRFSQGEGQAGIKFRGVVQRSGLRSPKPGMGVRIPPPLPGLGSAPGALKRFIWPRGR